MIKYKSIYLNLINKNVLVKYDIIINYYNNNINKPNKIIIPNPTNAYSCILPGIDLSLTNASLFPQFVKARVSIANKKRVVPWSIFPKL